MFYLNNTKIKRFWMVPLGILVISNTSDNVNFTEQSLVTAYVSQPSDATENVA